MSRRFFSLLKIFWARRRHPQSAVFVCYPIGHKGKKAFGRSNLKRRTKLIVSERPHTIQYCSMEGRIIKVHVFESQSHFAFSLVCFLRKFTANNSSLHQRHIDSTERNANFDFGSNICSLSPSSYRQKKKFVIVSQMSRRTR